VATPRRALDAYLTPRWATEELVRRVAIEGEVLEPCAGDGAISEVLGKLPGVLVTTNDLDWSREGSDWHFDVTIPFDWFCLCSQHNFDWIISNPPFSHAPQIVRAAYESARVGIAMLLRLSFLEPCDNRGAWLAAHPPTRLIVLPRISFTGDGGKDMVTCAWVIFEHGVSKQTIEIVEKESNQ